MKNIEEAFYDGSRSGDSEYPAEKEKQSHQQSVPCCRGRKLYRVLHMEPHNPQPVQTELGCHAGLKR